MTLTIPSSRSGLVLKTGDTMSGPLVINGGTVTASTPVLDLSQTWNFAGTTFTGLKFNVTDSASASASLLFDWQVGGVSKASVRKDGLIKAAFLESSGVYFGTLADTILVRGAANTLEFRNGANAQTWNVYGTYTDASNYRRLRSTMTTGGAVTIAAEGLGTGASGNTLDLVVNGTTGLTITAAGSLSTAGSITSTGGGVNISTSSSFRVNSRFTLYGGTDGQYIFGNYGLTDADIFLKLGVNTSAAAGIKRVGTALQIRLNDDSAFAVIQPLSVSVPASNGTFGWTASSYFAAPADGIIRMTRILGLDSRD